MHDRERLLQEGLTDREHDGTAFTGTRVGGVEISLDVETVHSVCPKCKILLVEANEPTDADLATSVNEAVKLGATVHRL